MERNENIEFTLSRQLRSPECLQSPPPIPRPSPYIQTEPLRLQTETDMVVEEVHKNIGSYEAQICLLMEGLQFQTEQMDTIVNLNHQGSKEFPANVETEEHVLEINKELLQLKGHQRTVNRLEQQVHENNCQLLNLRDEHQHLSHTVNKMLENLQNQNEEFHRSKDECQEKYKVLEERFMVELNDKNQMWESSVQELKEELSKRQEEEYQWWRKEEEEKEYLHQMMDVIGAQVHRTMEAFYNSQKVWHEEYEADKEQLLFKEQMLKNSIKHLHEEVKHLRGQLTQKEEELKAKPEGSSKKVENKGGQNQQREKEKKRKHRTRSWLKFWKRKDMDSDDSEEGEVSGSVHVSSHGSRSV